MLDESRYEQSAPLIIATPDSIPLLNHRGEEVELASHQGDILVISFIFTRCPDICPALTSTFLDLEYRIPAEIEGTTIQFVSITVDPEFDRPEVLATYRESFDGAPDRWQLWTGEQADIDATVAQFQLALERNMDGDAPRIAHSDRFVVLDPKGQIRNFYPTSELGLDGLVADLDVIARGF
jgi:protein SCO1/2